MVHFRDVFTRFAPAVLLTIFLGLWQFDVPGVYMDAVHPDHLVVRLLSATPENVPVWGSVQQLVFNKFPTIIQAYHGALTYYFGLPFYALWGTDVLGIRLTNVVFALMVLVSAGVLLKFFNVQAWLASLALVALAADPAFIFSFRNQYYITLQAMFAVLLALAIIARTTLPTRRQVTWVGFLSGMAFYGYFIHVFFTPTIIAFMLWRWNKSLPWKELMWWWICGWCCGVALYFVGYALLAFRLFQIELPWVALSSLIGLLVLVIYLLTKWGFFQSKRLRTWSILSLATVLTVLAGFGGVLLFDADLLARYTVKLEAIFTGSALLSFSERPRFFWLMLMQTINGSGTTSMLLGVGEETPLWNIKATLLLAMPLLALAQTLAMPLLALAQTYVKNDVLKTSQILCIYGLLAGSFIMVLLFGSRLGTHHLAPLLPVLYILFALAMQQWVSWAQVTRHSYSGYLVACLCFGFLLSTSLMADRTVYARLEQSGGVGFSSDAIVKYAKNSIRDDTNALRFFPDWGVFTSFVMITNGARPIIIGDISDTSIPIKAKNELCAGKNFEVVEVLHNKPLDQKVMFDNWVSKFEWPGPVIKYYKQRDGVPILKVIRWSANDGSARQLCNVPGHNNVKATPTK